MNAVKIRIRVSTACEGCPASGLQCANAVHVSPRPRAKSLIESQVPENHRMTDPRRGKKTLGNSERSQGERGLQKAACARDARAAQDPRKLLHFLGEPVQNTAFFQGSSAWTVFFSILGPKPGLSRTSMKSGRHNSTDNAGPRGLFHVSRVRDHRWE